MRSYPLMYAFRGSWCEASWLSDLADLHSKLIVCSCPLSPCRYRPILARPWQCYLLNDLPSSCFILLVTRSIGMWSSCEGTPLGMLLVMRMVRFSFGPPNLGDSPQRSIALSMSGFNDRCYQWIPGVLAEASEVVALQRPSDAAIQLRLTSESACWIHRS